MGRTKFSWIITSLTVYIVGLVLYVFRDNNGDFWVNYYWLLNAYLVMIGLSFGLMTKLKTNKEKVLICYVLGVRILLVIYYGICLVWEHEKSELEGTIVFWIAMTLAGFLSVVSRKYYVHGK